MRKSGFYPRLALTGILRSGQFYYPYLLACMGTAAMFYIMVYLATNRMISTMSGAAELTLLLDLGCAVIAFFSVYIIFYANNFVMKRRRRELGLYNILGLEKRHIARLLSCETAILGGASILGGLALGILLSKLILLLLLKMLNFKVQMGFSVSRRGLAYTAVLFAGIFLTALVMNLFRIHLSNPVELLHSDDVGEREPKTRKVPAAVGFITLAAGYLIANTVKNPLQALVWFFLAVILVIIGTECLFTAGSVVILKRLRANKRFYYQPKHFVAVSGMIYRMKQNARGLANICILSTMVLVTVSTSVCLHIGMEESLKSMYPTDVYLSMSGADASETQALRTDVQRAVTAFGRKATLFADQTTLSFPAVLQNGKLIPGTKDNDAQAITVLTAAEYTRLTGKPVSLGSGEVLCRSVGTRMPDTFTFADRQWRIAKRMKSVPVKERSGTVLTEFQYLVVADDTVLKEWNQALESKHTNVAYEIFMNLNGTDSQKIQFCRRLQKVVDGRAVCISRQIMQTQMLAFYGGFLFLGLFLGILFLLVTALIIYYKQISEGYQDRRRFEIMQQVGMSRREVRQSIQSQVLMVFFLPLLVAGIHVFGAFHMISKMLALFSLTNIRLFALCTLGTLGVFAVIYALVYLGTAQAYYKIVRGPEGE